MELTKEQEAVVLDMVASKISEKIYKDIVGELGQFVGPQFGIPVSLAARITGWNQNWIRRNIKPIDAKGQTQLIAFGEMQKAWEDRKG